MDRYAESVALDLTANVQPGDASEVDNSVAEPARITHSTNASAMPSSSTPRHKQERILVQPLLLPNTELEMVGVVNMGASLARDSSWPQHQMPSEKRQLPMSRRGECPADNTVTGGWRRTDVQRSTTDTPMRSTWAGPGSFLGPSTRRKATKMVDWNVAWLEHPHAG